MKLFAKKFYESAKWKRCRKSYISKRITEDGGMCEVCHERLGYIVHHKQMLTRENINDPDVTLNHNNLSYECKKCHDEHEGHGVGKTKQPLVIFDKDGQPIKKVEAPL